MESPAGRLALEDVHRELSRLQALRACKKLARHLEAQQQAHARLRAAAERELEARRQKQEHDELAAQLERLRISERNLCAEPVSGPPDWEAKADAELWGSWVKATQFTYSLHEPPLPAAASAARTFRLGTSPAVYVIEGEAQLQIYRRHFSKGGMRMAYYARMPAANHFGGSSIKRVVKGAIMQHLLLEAQLADAHTDAIMQAIACHMASSFNSAVGSAADRAEEDPAFASVPNAWVTFCTPSVLVLPGSAGGYAGCGSGSGNCSSNGPAVLLMERFIPGKFTKWIRNDGGVLGTRDAVVEAFAHFSLEFSRKQLGQEMVALDLQGCYNSFPPLDTERKIFEHYQLSDPVVCSAERRFGRMDLGAEAIQRFMREHSCGELCRTVRSISTS